MWDKLFTGSQFGPPGGPRPGQNAPHQDVGRLIVDGIEDIQSAGESISGALDMPLKATVGISGPHRLVDGSLDMVLDEAKKLVHQVTRR